MLKALLILDEKENDWLLDAFNESIYCHSIDLETLGVDTEHLQHALQMVADQGHVLLMDSALAWNFVFKVALRVGGKIPDLPILLLPNYHAPEGLAESMGSADLACCSRSLAVCRPTATTTENRP
jgi:hypothetical protein